MDFFGLFKIPYKKAFRICNNLVAESKSINDKKSRKDVLRKFQKLRRNLTVALRSKDKDDPEASKMKKLLSYCDSQILRIGSMDVASLEKKQSRRESERKQKKELAARR